MRWEDLDKFTKAYIEAALWSSTDDNDEPLDSNYDQFDLAPETMEKIAADCRKFQLDNYGELESVYLSDLRHGDCEHAGHDFWLTRNHHGAGFWDGDWPEPEASKLTDSAHSFGEVYLYVGDDGQLYQG